MELQNEYEKQVDSIIEKDLVKRQLLIDEIAIKILGKYNKQLDEKPYGSCVLKEDEIASIVSKQILKYHSNLYDLKCYSIMPNHVHLLLSALGNTPEGKSDPVNIWLKYIKGSSARLINQKLNNNGILWASESWDRLIRNEFHYHNSFYYTVNNPIKANLGAKYTIMPFIWRCDIDEFN